MLKKIFSLSLIALMLFSCVASINASHIKIDGDWRMTHNFQIKDLGTGKLLIDSDCDSFSWDCAAGKSHEFDVDSTAYKHHEMLFLIQPKGSELVKPNNIAIHVADWDGGDVDLEAMLDAKDITKFGAIYQFSVRYIINNNWTWADFLAGRCIPRAYGDINM